MSDYDHEILSKTIYAEARGEDREGQLWVGHVIMNRAEKRGLSIAKACLQPYQFECWNGVDDIEIDEPRSYKMARKVAREVMKRRYDPTGGCDHYNNPVKEPNAKWVPNVKKIKKVGNHQFYKE